MPAGAAPETKGVQLQRKISSSSQIYELLAYSLAKIKLKMVSLAVVYIA